MEEKHEFKSMLKDGRISHLLNEYKPWKPWWLYKTQAPTLITDSENVSSSSKLPDTIPTVTSNLVPLPSLTSILPHVHVRFDLFEILFAYVIINIRYRGDANSYIFESGTEFLHIASRHLIQKTEIVDEEHDPMSVLRARISLIRERLQDRNISYRISEEFFTNLLGDIVTIIHGPYPHQTPSNVYVLAVLSDLQRFLVQIQKYKSSVESTTNDELKKDMPETLNVFHMNRSRKPKATINKCVNF